MRYLTKRRNPIRGHRLGGMSTILETQVATKKLKKLQRKKWKKSKLGHLKSPHLSATSWASVCLFVYVLDPQGGGRVGCPRRKSHKNLCVPWKSETQDVFSGLRTEAADYLMLTVESQSMALWTVFFSFFFIYNSPAVNPPFHEGCNVQFLCERWCWLNSMTTL